MSKLNDVINEFATEVLKLASEEIDRLRLERDEFKTKCEFLTAELEASQKLRTVENEVDETMRYERSCSVGFALQRDEAKQQLDERNKVISNAFVTMKVAESRSKLGLPFEDELNEALDILSYGTYFKEKDNNESM